MDTLFALAGTDVQSWITWSLQGLVGFLLSKLWGKVEETNRQLHELRIEIAKEYATVEEVKLVRSRVHDIAGWMMGEKALRDALRDAGGPGSQGC